RLGLLPSLSLSLLVMLPPRRSTLFPYTTLFRSTCCRYCRFQGPWRSRQYYPSTRDGLRVRRVYHRSRVASLWSDTVSPAYGGVPDRKSTRLNSSHVKISYAVFCLKKKKKKRHSA